MPNDAPMVTQTIALDITFRGSAGEPGYNKKSPATLPGIAAMIPTNAAPIRRVARGRSNPTITPALNPAHSSQSTAGAKDVSAY
jgi:hypothetical protein